MTLVGNVALKRVVDPARPITYGIVQAGPDIPDGVPYIRPVDMKEFARDLDPAALRRTSPEIARQYQRSTVRAGDLIVSIGPSYGKTLVVPERLAGSNLTQGTARVAPSRNANARFLQWALSSPEARAHWGAAVGGATFGGLNLGPLSSTPVPLWRPHQQEAIADFLDVELDRITHLYARLRRFQDQVAAYARSRAQALVDDARGEILRLKHVIAAPLSYGVLTPELDDGPEGVPLLRILDLDDHGVRRDTVLARISSRQDAEYRRTKLVKGDVLVSVVGTIGRSTVVGDDLAGANISRALARVKLRASFPPALLRELFRLPTFERFWQETSYGTAQAVLNLSTLREMPIKCPPTVDERLALAARLDEAWAQAHDAARRVEGFHLRLNEYREALILEAVTGRLNVSKVSDSHMNERMSAALEPAST